MRQFRRATDRQMPHAQHWKRPWWPWLIILALLATAALDLYLVHLILADKALIHLAMIGSCT